MLNVSAFYKRFSSEQIKIAVANWLNYNISEILYILVFLRTQQRKVKKDCQCLTINTTCCINNV